MQDHTFYLWDDTDEVTARLCGICGNPPEDHPVDDQKDGRVEVRKGKRMTRQEWQTLKVQDFDRLEARIIYLESLLARAYPMLRNPYTPKDDLHMWSVHDTIIREVETVIATVPDPGPDAEEATGPLPCASCDGGGCPTCAMAAIEREHR